MQLSYSIRYVAVLSWQMEEYSKHREHRNYLEESHHAAHYIADDFGMVSAKTKHELVRRAEDSMWIPVNYDLPADPKHRRQRQQQVRRKLADRRGRDAQKLTEELKRDRVKTILVLPRKQ